MDRPADAADVPAGVPDGVPSDVADASQLRAIAVELAEGAGRLVRERVAAARSEGGRTVVSAKSTPTDLVTDVDRAAEEWLTGRLAQRRPGDAVLGEEGGAAEGSTGVRWLLDPIDGTVNFVLGLPDYAVSVAAEVEGVVVAGAVFAPATGELFHAHRGGGAALRHTGKPSAPGPGDPTGADPADRPSSEGPHDAPQDAPHDAPQDVALHGPRAVPLARAVVGTGFAYDPMRRSAQAAVFARLADRIADVRRIGSASLDLCAVAVGRLDAYYEVGLNPWDWAAGLLVATEAGAVASGLRGREPGAQMTAVAGPSCAAELFALLTELDADAVG